MGMRRDGKQDSLSSVRSNEAERFIALLIVHHGEAIEELRRAGRRKSQNLSLPGLWVPSASAIAVIVIAGREGLTLESALSETRIVDRKKSRFTKAMENIAQDVAAALKGEEPFKEEWILHLRRALQAGDVESTMENFSGVLSRGPMTAEGLRQAIKDAEQRETASRNRVLDAYLLDAADTLHRPPVYYPPHLDVLRLAGVLKAGEVLEKAVLDQERNEGLYSEGTPALRDLRPALEVAREHSRFILLGDPGQGKTTVLQALVLDHVVNEHKPALFVRLDDLGKIASERPPMSLENAAEAVIFASDMRLNFFCPSEAKTDLLEQITHDPDFLLAFDGLDEVSLPERRAAVDRVLQILARAASGCMAFSSRYAGYVRPPFIEIELGLGPMEDAAAFVDDWFSEGQPGKDRALKAVRSEKIAELARIPLLAGFICYVAETEPVKSTKYGVYTQYIKLFLAQRWKPGHLWRKSGEILERERFATELAWFMATRLGQSADVEEGKSLPNPSLALTVSLQEWNLHAALSKEKVSFVEDDGLLVPHGSRHSSAHDLTQLPYRWIHRTIQEHLTGRALSEWVEKDPSVARPIIRSALLRPAWNVVLEHAADSMSERGIFPGVVDDILDFVDEGDANDRLLRAVAWLLTEQSAIRYRRNEVIVRLVAERLFHLAFMLDPTLLLAYLEENLSNMPPSHLESLAYQMGPWVDQEAFDEKWMPLLVELNDRNLAKPEYLSLMAKFDRAEAERQAVSLITTNPFANPAYKLKHIFKNASAEAVTSLLDEAKKSGRDDYHRVHELLEAAQYAKRPDFRDLLRASFEGEEDPHEALLYFADPYATVPWDLLDLPTEVISSSLHDPNTPPPIAKEVARFCPAPALQPNESLSPWARLGAWARNPDNPGVPEFPAGWSAGRANHALAQLLGGGKDAPDLSVDHIEEYHIAVQWGIQHPGDVPGKTLLEVVRLDDIDLSPRYWWMGGFHWIPSHLGLLPVPVIIETIHDTLSDAHDWDYHVSRMIQEVVTNRRIDETDAVLSELLALPFDTFSTKGLPVNGWYPPQDKDQAIRWALRLLELASLNPEWRQTALQAINVAAGWLQSHDVLPTYWRRCLTSLDTLEV